MTAAEIRKLFVDFFKSKQHEFVPSSSLVPMKDPTLLFVNAGMNQFKDIFLDKAIPNFKRAANYQKCLRVSGKHNDLEDVGTDTYHHTFFEMLGNWSFGDYYKKEAIEWAWELFTKKMKLPKERLYATVYYKDDEAEELWKKLTDIDPSHISRFKEKENFWEMGDTGPCGPCSEIHIDMGEGTCDHQHVPGHKCGVNVGCSRYMELWNLVFMQYNRNEKGELDPLKNKHVDTGAGLERLVSVLQGKKSNYDTDLFQPIIQKIAQWTGKKYEGNDAIAMRVISDHIRTLTFSISDGIIPSNEGRGYVIRRILRRAYRYGKKIGLNQPFLHKLVPVVLEIMGEAYPELAGNQKNIEKMILLEEEKFAATLDNGLELFEKVVSSLKNKVFPGDKAFTLYDTFGFPLDLTQLLCREKGLELDVDKFNAEMEKQKQASRESAKFRMQSEEIDWKIIAEGKTEFNGYDKTQISGAKTLKYSIIGHEIRLMTDKTPFYAELGGQAADKGMIIGKGFEIDVTDVQKNGDYYVHYGVLQGSFDPKSELTMEIDEDRRNAIKKNHTATHLLHKALKLALGSHVNQSGSVVDDERLRFDFSHYNKMTDEEIRKVEILANQEVQKANPVKTTICAIDEAKKMGATALFGEKYGDTVRVVEVPDFSMEFCGGTHASNTGEIGVIKIISESSVASGTRRIEALTGLKAAEVLIQSYDTLNELSKTLNVETDKVSEKIADLQKENKKLKKDIASGAGMKQDLKVDLKPSESLNGISIYLQVLESIPGANFLKELNDQIKSKEKSFISVLVGKNSSTIHYVAGSGADNLKKISAQEIAKILNSLMEGKGGGRPDMAQGTLAAFDETQLKNALAEIKKKLG